MNGMLVDSNVFLDVVLDDVRWCEGEGRINGLPLIW